MAATPGAVVFRQLLCSFGQQLASHQNQIAHACNQNRQPQWGKVKEAKRLKACTAHLAADDNIGRCTDQRQHATNEGGKGQRHQQL